MTFCLGITVKEGLIAIADTRITAGNEMYSNKKSPSTKSISIASSS